ncbi:MAG: ATP-binding protein [Phaeodactylibacter sp.]|nr:ATP-binding protein [Phaeodactylibacter sp.]
MTTVKIVVTGPESSGKTTLAKQLAATLEVPWVPEYARMYLENINRPYTREDLKVIAEGQQALESGVLEQHPPLIICDTDLLTIKIWSEVKYGSVDQSIHTDWLGDRVTGYLLCVPDIPWEDDPQRENPFDRDSIFNLYHTALTNAGKPFHLIKGTGERDRLIQSLEYIARWLDADAVTS